jgi:hypothetical protein
MAQAEMSKEGNGGQDLLWDESYLRRVPSTKIEISKWTKKVTTRRNSVVRVLFTDGHNFLVH